MSPAVDTTPAAGSGEEESRRAVEARMAAREQERLAELQLKRHEKEKRTNQHETMDYFLYTFNDEYDAIAALTQELTVKAKRSKTDHAAGGSSQSMNEVLGLVRDVQSRIDLLQKSLNDATRFLPSKSIEHYTARIKRLQTTVNSTRDSLIPKQKFSFKSKRTTAAKPEPADAVAEKPPDAVAEKPVDVATSTGTVEVRDENKLSCGFYKRSNESNLEMSPEECNNQDVMIQDISHCNIRVVGNPSTLHLHNIQSSRILIGPVSTSVFLSDCRDSTFAFGCQQMRCHSTQRCTFYVHISARGIIEDTHSVFISPYSFSYPQVEHHFQMSGLLGNSAGTNNWNKIDDFNWLSKSEKSPNWSELPESERESFQ